jgi:hypothetical protein
MQSDKTMYPCLFRFCQHSEGSSVRYESLGKESSTISSFQSACNNSELHLGRLDLRPLKRFVVESYPKDSAIFDIIVAEPDFIDALEFLAKMKIYLKLSRRRARN